MIILRRYSKVMCALAALFVSYVAYDVITADDVSAEFVTAKSEALKRYELEVESSGQIRAGKELYLAVNKGGRLDDIKVREGQPVKAGELIAIVDQTSNKAHLQSALTSFQLAATEYFRTQRLYRSRSVTKQEYDVAEAEYNLKKSDLEQAKQQLEDSIIRSPVDGVVALIAFNQGDIVPDGSRVAVVEDQSEYRLTVRVPRSFRDHLIDVKKVRATIYPYDPDNVAVDHKSAKRVRAVVELLNPDSDYDGSDLDVQLHFKKIPEGFHVNQAVLAKLTLKTFRNVLQVERRAVLEHNGHQVVVIRNEDDTYSILTPEILAERGDYLIIKNRLSKQDEVMGYNGPGKPTGVLARLQPFKATGKL